MYLYTIHLITTIYVCVYICIHSNHTNTDNNNQTLMYHVQGAWPWDVRVFDATSVQQELFPNIYGMFQYMIAVQELVQNCFQTRFRNDFQTMAS